MERKDFLAALGLGAGSLIVSSCLGACGKSDSATPSTGTPTSGGSTKIDFTLNISTNADINAKGWTIQNNIIIAKNGADFIALSAACTHQGASLTYNSSNNTFPCSLTDPSHGSVFDANGSKTKGPATSALKKYLTSLSGTTLRVYES